jgi:phage repressor protein C with HTH and peptisase S24 domain
MEGDFVLVLRTRKKYWTHKGKVVLFKHPACGTMVKRVKHNKQDALYVTSDNPQGTDSSTFGEIPREQVIGRVLWVIPR